MRKNTTGVGVGQILSSFLFDPLQSDHPQGQYQLVRRTRTKTISIGKKVGTRTWKTRVQWQENWYVTLVALYRYLLRGTWQNSLTSTDYAAPIWVEVVWIRPFSSKSKRGNEHSGVSEQCGRVSQIQEWQFEMSEWEREAQANERKDQQKAQYSARPFHNASFSRAALPLNRILTIKPERISFTPISFQWNFVTCSISFVSICISFKNRLVFRVFGERGREVLTFWDPCLRLNKSGFSEWLRS